MMNALRNAGDRFSMYLPVLLMAVLALGSWWLVRNAPSAPAAAAQPSNQRDPDYTMTRFMVQDFDAQGRLQSEIHGQRADHFPHNDTLEVQQVDMRSYPLDGSRTTATADKGISNGDASEVQLWGNAVVVRQPLPPKEALRFEGDFLHAWAQEERVQSHLPVVLTQGKNRFTGERLDYDNVSQVVKMQGRVRGVLAPTP